MITNDDTQKILGILCASAKARTTVSFEDILMQLGRRVRRSEVRKLTRRLRFIALHYVPKGMPLLTAIAIKRKSGTYSSRFYGFVRQWSRTESGTDRDQFFREEQERVFNEDWSIFDPIVESIR